MQKISTLSLFIILVFCSVTVIGQSSYWVTTDAGTQMEVFPAGSKANSGLKLKSGSSVSSGSNSLTTLFATDNSFAGNMFDVEVVGSSPISINAFDINISTYNASTCTIRVYYKEGTYVGNESTSSGWTLASEISGVVPQGANLPTHISTDDILLEAGNTYGFYITITDFPSAEMLYTNGSNVYNNDDIKITTGIGKGNPDFTGSTFEPRTWNGTIYYSPAEVVPVSSWAVIVAFLLITTSVVLRIRKKRFA